MPFAASTGFAASDVRKSMKSRLWSDRRLRVMTAAENTVMC